MERYYSVLFLAALIFLAVGILFALIRAIKGPRVADRIVGINMIGTMSLSALAILAVKLRQSWLLDVSLIYCMISFLAVLVLTKIYIAAHTEEPKEEEKHE